MNGKKYDVRVGGTKVHLRTEETDEGGLRKVHLNVLQHHSLNPRERTLVTCLTNTINIGLARGVPLEGYVDALAFTRFDPQGRVTGDENIKFATSIVDYVARRLGADYLGRTDYFHVKPARRDVLVSAPSCATCGHVTVRNGSGFRCHNCGSAASA